MTTTRITRRDAERIVRKSRELCHVPNLSGLDLSGLDLSGLDLIEAILTGADLTGVNLTGTPLTGANLTGATGVIGLGHTPSGSARMIPLLNGTWHLTVGCWGGTTDELRTLIAGEDWPEATRPEQARRRPILTTLADHADNLAVYHHDWLTAVVERWGDKEEDQ